MKTKKQIYKGPKKNHAAIFIGVPKSKVNFNSLTDNRIRILHSQPNPGEGCNPNADVAHAVYNDAAEGKWHSPCWSWGCKGLSDKKLVASMRTYDKKCDRETIFLGYVKDCE